GANTFITREKAATLQSYEIGEPVYPVTLQDILDIITTDTVILKIDIEGHECRALIPYLTNKNKSQYIPYVMMEWIHVSWNTDGYCPNVHVLIQAFQDAGYYPVGLNLRKVSIADEKSWLNVLWVHNKAAKQF
ncbi:uncharacterized protein LOC111717259, partial [Eurytemora carolleeae]|uniref:uncharacterized protein LOC111717259 n=1 Tax=Eurytemora carolleeae TaxID=1294199 RepID=UPI000C78D479